MITCADNYITEHGLKFNNTKTKCIIYSKDPFVTAPEWHLNNTVLHIAQNIDYLGAVLGNNGSNAHIQARLSSCRKAFYFLQGAGLCKQGLNIQTAVHVFRSTCNSILTYGCEDMFLSNDNKKDLHKLQGKFIKCIVGLGPMYRTTPLLKALNLQNISHVIDMNNLCLLKNLMTCNSGASKFDCLMLGNNNNSSKILTTRVRNICEKWNIIVGLPIWINILRRAFYVKSWHPP